MTFKWLNCCLIAFASLFFILFFKLYHGGNSASNENVKIRTIIKATATETPNPFFFHRRISENTTHVILYVLKKCVETREWKGRNVARICCAKGISLHANFWRDKVGIGRQHVEAQNIFSGVQSR